MVGWVGLGRVRLGWVGVRQHMSGWVGGWGGWVGWVGGRADGDKTIHIMAGGNTGRVPITTSVSDIWVDPRLSHIVSSSQ